MVRLVILVLTVIVGVACICPVNWVTGFSLPGYPSGECKECILGSVSDEFRGRCGKTKFQ